MILPEAAPPGAGWSPFRHRAPERLPLLVCLHGWLLSGRLWQPLRAELEPQWQLWSPDLPGFGLAERPRGLQPSLASYGRWVADEARRQASGRPLVLVGHSLGGSLALHAAGHLEGQLVGLVQIAAGGGVYQPRPFRTVRRGGAAFLRWRPRWLAGLPGAEALRSPLTAELRAARGLLACSMTRGAVQQLPALTAQLQVPSLWIAGERDQVMEPRYVRHLAAYSPGHRFELLAGAGHLPVGRNTAPLAALIRTWLADEGIGGSEAGASGAVGLGAAGLGDPSPAAQSVASPRS